MSLDGAPAVPDEFKLYNTYETDPKYAKKFTIVWTACTAAFVLVSLPNLVRSIRTGRIWQGWMIVEDWRKAGYTPLKEHGGEDPQPSRQGAIKGRLRSSFWARGKASIDTVSLRPVPWLGLDFGQLFVVSAYLATLLACIVHQAPLAQNSNRAGFLSLAQLPFIFAFSMKSSPLTFLLNRGYEKFNFIHRWAGRFLWLSATVHGSLWINNRIKNGQKERLWKEMKEREGIAAYSLICLIALTSLRPVRRWGYNIFYAIHIGLFASFFIVICYHTPYATPWIIPPIAFYAFDVLVRLIRTTVKDAYLEAPDSGMTLVHIPDCSNGWIAGQHVQLRVFFGGRLFESHPLTITNAPPSVSVTASAGQWGGGMTLAARTTGDWTKALNDLARSELLEDNGLFYPSSEKREKNQQPPNPEKRVSVMISGPFGGPSFDFAMHQNVLLVAGGAGATFSLGILDDIVGRISRYGRSGNTLKTRRVRFVWCVKEGGCTHWFTRQFRAIARSAAALPTPVIVEFKFFLTANNCDPCTVCSMPNADVDISTTKPAMSEILSSYIDDTLASSPPGEEDALSGEVCQGLAIGASGPVGLTRAMRHAVATQIGPRLASRLGGVQIHTEEFCL